MNSYGIDLKDKIIYAHKGFFDKESIKQYRENSVEVCKITTTKNYIQAIELDIRKSKEGILYCYHGTIFQYIFVLKFPHQFSSLRRKFGVSTLEDILKVITPDKVIALDIKDTKVTKDDLLKVFGNKKFTEVIICNKSVSYLKQFYDMPKIFTKMLNGNVLSVFYDMDKLKKDNFRYFEIVFPVLATKKILSKIEKSGLRLVGFPYVIFLSEKSYINAVKKYKLKYIPSYFVN